MKKKNRIIAIIMTILLILAIIIGIVAANKQKEIKEGLIRATNIIDLIIEIIRGSQSQKQEVKRFHGTDKMEQNF